MTKLEVCNDLQRLRDKKQLEPYINHIRFPCYRNLKENLQIEFNFPLTAIVGQNGTNKSSVLRALYGCPEGLSVESFWFSTDIDPISDKNGRPRYIYSYFQPDAKRNVEIIKTRIQRLYSGKNNKTKKLNPDYWEPSRPIIGDGMEKMPEESKGMKGRTKTRWKGMKKEVLFMDFRSEISAFDKYFYHGDLKQTLTHNSKQDYIRSKSTLIKEAIDNSLQTKKMYKGKKEQVYKNIILPVEQMDWISKILGRDYSLIKILVHKFFKLKGESVILKTKDLNYSEAFAGSGEFSVVMLVHQIFEAKSASLIILDEPEVSLHPGAQERLVDFLLDRIKVSKHQIVVGTHSPFILKNLPAPAIKTLFLDPALNKIQATKETLAEEAFFHLGVAHENKKMIFVEDRLAAEVVNKGLRKMGQAIHELFEIKYPPGGASVLLMSYLPTYARTDRTDVLFLMDGDQKPKEELSVGEVNALLSDDDLSSSLRAILGGELDIPVDGGNKGPNLNQIREARIKILSFCQQFLSYIPGHTPEEFIWDNMNYDISNYNISFDKIKCYKERFRVLSKVELGRADYENVTSNEIFQVQQRCLATVNDDLLNELRTYIRDYL